VTEAPNNDTTPIDNDHVDDLEIGVSRPFIGVIVATVVLYLGKDILVPLAMASILAVAFSPIASRLELFVGRFLAAAVIVVAAITAICLVAYLLTVELTAVAVNVAGYSGNIATKLAALEGSTPPWLQSVEQGVSEVQSKLARSTPKPKGPAPKVVQAQAAPPNLQYALEPAVPILVGIGKGILVIVLFFFLLYRRWDLRGRLIMLAARGRITIAAEAIETAGGNVGRYLLLISIVNFGFGIGIGIVAWLLGLPNAAFWGALAFVLRYIPYVGTLAAAVLPTLVAFAVFPGWGKSFEVFGSFVILDQVAVQLVEPFLIGRGISVSPVALLFSAMYWSWLWGLPGLLLATPLTACLKVAGDYIPELGFFSILLGADTVIEGYNDYYRMLLELDQLRAVALAISYCDQNGLESTFDDVLNPAVRLAGDERFASHISQENLEFIVKTTRTVVTELGERFIKPPTTWRLRVLGICAPGEVHDLGLLMLLELLRHAGAAANLIAKETPEEIREFVKGYAPDIVCLSCTMAECLPAAEDLVRALKLDAPGLTMMAGGAAALASPAGLLASGCAQICGSRSDARRLVRRFALRRARSQVIKAPEPTIVRTGTSK
jgi:predicted PurR-regulated permease PerM/methanogenic corrinoid protein MtbC1